MGAKLSAACIRDDEEPRFSECMASPESKGIVLPHLHFGDYISKALDGDDFGDDDFDSCIEYENSDETVEFPSSALLSKRTQDIANRICNRQKEKISPMSALYTPVQTADGNVEEHKENAVECRVAYEGQTVRASEALLDLVQSPR